MSEIRYGCESAVIDVTDPQRRAELFTVIARGINCMADRPKWIEDLYDEMKDANHEAGNNRENR